MAVFAAFDRGEPEVALATGMIKDPATLERLALPSGVKPTAAVIEAPITDVGSQIASYLAIFVHGALFVYLLVLVRRFMMKIENADAASFWDVSLLRRIGWVLIAYNVLQFVGGVIEYLVIENSIAGRVSDFPDQLFVSPISAVAGLTAFAFAEVLRRGAQLHKDLEGTV